MNKKKKKKKKIFAKDWQGFSFAITSVTFMFCGLTECTTV